MRSLANRKCIKKESKGKNTFCGVTKRVLPSSTSIVLYLLHPTREVSVHLINSLQI